MRRILEEGLWALGLCPTAGQLDSLIRYVEEIELFNPVYRLVSYSGREELLVRHILDCASGVPVLRAHLGQDRRLADLGSGAGLPGIVLAILMEDVQVTLVERMKRRVDFLSNAVVSCNLKTVEVLSKDVNEVGKTFPLVTCRAFRPLSEIMDPVNRILSPSGCLCAYKGLAAKAQAEMACADGWNGEIVPLAVPGLDEERCMLVLKRIGE